ncbi:hypothetical protein CRI93_00225 [Longimonas halophila]|uniref:Uncharacterized protein n=1 Tax=Longimonas halophila TaxID=1469170 RepID=A0A2H3NW91_9BACT|nr:hypothetical protein [Longimonas halophila]PEN09194.1 hypothetical protein CRI93_00225 [Longimonas halophila]
MPFRRLLFGGVLALLLAGCSTPQLAVYPLTDLQGRAPTTQVDVYPHPDSLQRAHREIAVISATERKQVYTLEEGHPELMDALTETAREIGADAIVVIKSSDPTLLAGGDDPKSAERRDRAQRDAEDGTIPRAPWTIRVKAIVYQ